MVTVTIVPRSVPDAAFRRSNDISGWIGHTKSNSSRADQILAILRHGFSSGSTSAEWQAERTEQMGIDGSALS